VRDVEIHFDVDVVTCDDGLSSNRADLDFDVDDAERLGTDINLNETRVDGLVELSETGDQANGSCLRNVNGVDERWRENRPCWTLRKGLGKGQQGKAPKKPMKEPRPFKRDP
jgi:hypothetical protein